MAKAIRKLLKTQHKSPLKKMQNESPPKHYPHFKKLTFIQSNSLWCLPLINAPVGSKDCWSVDTNSEQNLQQIGFAHQLTLAGRAANVFMCNHCIHTRIARGPLTSLPRKSPFVLSSVNPEFTKRVHKGCGIRTLFIYEYTINRRVVFWLLFGDVVRSKETA